MIMQRKHSTETEGLSGWIAVSGHDLVKKHGEEKAKVVRERRYALGLYYNSEDFPDDELERMYYIRKPKEMTKRSKVEDACTMDGRADLDNDMVKTLIDEDGPFRAGCVPDGMAASSSGQKALVDGLMEETSVAKPKKPKKKDEQNEGLTTVTPKTIFEQAKDLMADILQESTTSRKKSMSLGEVNYAGELAQQLLDHATKLEKYYSVLQKAFKGDVTDESFFQKIVEKVSKERKWFKTAEAEA